MLSQMSATELLMTIQKQQHFHDENYHREIARLPMPHRLQHMALHIAKYFSRLTVQYAASKDTTQTWVDTFIISTSICNIINKKISNLWDIGDENHLSILDLKKYLLDAKPLANQIMISFAENTEAITNVCEKMDHLESVDYRSILGASASKLASIAAAEIEQTGCFYEQVTNRLDGVKTKSIFHEV